MTHQEIEAQALTAAVDILYCMYDREEPNYTTDKIATLMSEAYKAGKAEQKQIDIDKADKWLRAHLPRVIENYPQGDNETTVMLNEDMRAEFRDAMEK